MFSKINKPKNFVNVFPEKQRFPRSIQNCILAPAAVACDICIVRRSAHPRGAFLCNMNEVSYYTKNFRLLNGSLHTLLISFMKAMIL
jgi:hypothetical protein